jgi:lipopolysaccharide transport protein LptA
VKPSDKLRAVLFYGLLSHTGVVRAELVKSIEELEQAGKKPATVASPEVHAPSPPALVAPVQPVPSKTPKRTASKAAVRTPKQHTPQRLTFTSDSLTGSRKQGSAELLGNVKIHHGDLFLQSKKAKMTFDEQSKELVRVIASGDVVLEKKAQEGSEAVYASGSMLEYDRQQNMVFLSKNAFLRQGSDVVRGDLIKYNVTNGLVQAEQVQGNVIPTPPHKKDAGVERGR